MFLHGLFDCFDMTPGYGIPTETNLLSTFLILSYNYLCFLATSMALVIYFAGCFVSYGIGMD